MSHNRVISDSEAPEYPRPEVEPGAGDLVQLLNDNGETSEDVTLIGEGKPVWDFLCGLWVVYDYNGMSYFVSRHTAIDAGDRRGWRQSL